MKKFAVVWKCDGEVVGLLRPAIFSTREECKDYIRRREAKCGFRMRVKIVPFTKAQ